MSYKGERLLPLQLTAASQLEKNRVVNISSSGVPSYPAYGTDANGITRHRGNANDYVIQVQPLDFVDRTFFLDLAGTVAAHALVFPTGTVGKVKAAVGTAQSRSISQPGSPTNPSIYIVPANATILATYSTATANQVGTYTGSWAYADATAGDIYYVADEGGYVVWNGTAWVDIKPVAYAGEAGTDTETIACYLTKKMQAVGWGDVSDGIRDTHRIVIAGQTASETDSDAEVVHLDQRILATDIAICSIEAQAGTASIQKAVCSAQTLTVTLSGNGGAGTIINYMILRACS